MRTTHQAAVRHLSLGSLAAVLLSFGLATGCGSSDSPTPPQASISGGEGSSSNAAPETPQAAEPPAPVQLTAAPSSTESPAQPPARRDPEVLIQTSLGNIRLRLDAENAPQTVDNFLENYVNRGFYDQTIFHYVDKGFMIAAGGYNEQYEAQPTRTPVTNESKNGLSNRRGTIAMARDPQYAHSATSQFYINLADNPDLDHQPSEDGLPNGYCVFGEVIEGMEVVDQIAQVEVGDRETFPRTPVEPVVIQSIEQVK